MAFLIKPAHVGISVPDIGLALDWYQKVLGYNPISIRYHSELETRIAFLEKDGFCIELFQHDQARALPEDRKYPNRDIITCGTKHLCFYTDSMDELKAHLDVCGVDMATDVFFMGPNKVLFIRDCAGNLLEFIQKGEAKL